MGDESPEPPPLTVPRLLGRGLALHCPVCGGGRLFRRWFIMEERCPRCGFRLERIEGHWLGALGINTIVTFAAVLIAVVAGFLATYPGPVAPAVVAVVATAIIVPLAFFPWSKTLWSAIDLAMRPLEPDDDVDPRWIPPAQHHEA
ncbi:MAG TPA: DUF983 domain-containing protein [Acidimicrobiales bacterium]|nr:DUF983 domain-containing protein [Acidimicrobiales bacterium]